jgi:hypothetical protein
MLTHLFSLSADRGPELFWFALSWVIILGFKLHMIQSFRTVRSGSGSSKGSALQTLLQEIGSILSSSGIYCLYQESMTKSPSYSVPSSITRPNGPASKERLVDCMHVVSYQANARPDEDHISPDNDP